MSQVQRLLSRVESSILIQSELKRSFSLLGMIGFSFSIVTRFDRAPVSKLLFSADICFALAGVPWLAY
jgi:hypothetical protein